jgi:hypothetical protein
LNASQALLDTTALAKISNATYGVAVSDTAASVSTALDALDNDAHLTSIMLTGGGTPTLSLTSAQALHDTAALGKIGNSSYGVAITDTAANVSAGLDALNSDAHLTSITLTDGGTPTLSLTSAQALGDTTALGKITNAQYSVAIVDMAANIDALTASQIAALGAAHVKTVAATNASIAVGLAKVQAFTAAGITLSVPAGDQAALSDTAANLETLSAAQIASLGSIGISAVASTDTSVSITAAQAIAFESAGIAVGVPSGARVSLSDTVAHLTSLTSTADRGAWCRRRHHHCHH